VDKNHDVTKTSIAFVNDLNLSETASFLDIELCAETHVEPNVETYLKLVSESLVDLVLNRAIELSNTSDVSAVFVGAFC
jgi:hypothetical protein